MRLSNLSIINFAAISIGMVALPCTYGMPANPLGTFQETQPDGTIVILSLNGDTHDSWMVDEEQYTVLKDPETGYFVYAILDGTGGLEPSSEVVRNRASKVNGRDGKVEAYQKQEEQHQKMPPNSFSDSVTSTKGSDLLSSSSESYSSNFKRQKNLRPSKRDCHNKICEEHYNNENNISDRKRTLRGGKLDLGENVTADIDTMFSSRRETSVDKRSRLRNLVLLLQWSDHSNRILPPREDYEILMNNDGPHYLCPTGSVRDVFLQNSYGTLEVDSYVTDWILMNNTEDYYSNANKGITTFIQDAVRDALKHVDDRNVHEGVDFDFFDEDEDGFIDSITFIHSGYPAEMGGTDSYGRFYEERIWSHKWRLKESFKSKKGRNVQVGTYHMSSGLWGLRGSAIARIGVIAHEMAHFLGLPDLYDYDSSSFGVGNYGLMANSWGSNGQQRHPPYMSPFAKIYLGWIAPVEATPGVNFVEASAEQDPSHPQVYMIQKGFPEGEFLLIENRQPVGFDELLPQGGLAIWHIDLGSTGTLSMVDVYRRQTREGYPEQEGWPENGNHYAVALLQADGYYDLEMRMNSGDYEDLFHADGVNELVPCKQKNDCQYPNTDSYQDGIIARSNVYITNISASGNIMSFDYMVGESLPTDSPTSIPTFSPSTYPTPSPSVNPTTEKERIGRKKGRVCRNDGQCTSGFCKKRWRWFFGMGWSYFGECELVE